MFVLFAARPDAVAISGSDSPILVGCMDAESVQGRMATCLWELADMPVGRASLRWPCWLQKRMR